MILYHLIGPEIFMDISPDQGKFSCFEFLEAEWSPNAELLHKNVVQNSHSTELHRTRAVFGICETWHTFCTPCNSLQCISCATDVPSSLFIAFIHSGMSLSLWELPGT